VFAPGVPTQLVLQIVVHRANGARCLLAPGTTRARQWQFGISSPSGGGDRRGHKFLCAVDTMVGE
jgi:hypothetical protein